MLAVLKANLEHDYDVEVRVDLPRPDMKPDNTVYTFVNPQELGDLLAVVTGVPELLPFRDRLVTHVQDLKDENAVKYREQAHKEHNKDGECEVDTNGIVSVSDDGGAYVMAWVWVYDKDAGVVREAAEG